MRLAKLSAFRRMIYAPGSEPALATLRARIDQIPGGRVEHGRYYVDLDEYDRATRLRSALQKRQAELASQLGELV